MKLLNFRKSGNPIIVTAVVFFALPAGPIITTKRFAKRLFGFHANQASLFMA